MSNGRSEETEGDFNEISLDQPNESSQSDQLGSNLNQNLSTSEINTFYEHNRNNSNGHLDESEHTHDPDKSDLERTDLHSTQLQTKPDSSVKDYPCQTSNYNYTYDDELQEIRSPENTSRYGPAPNLNNFEKVSPYIENFNSHNLKIYNNDEDDYKVEQKLDYGFQNIHTEDQYESNIVYRHEHKEMEDDSDDRVSEPRGYMQESSVDHLHEDAVEYDLSDQQSPEQLSEPGGEGSFSDIDLNPEPEAKIKHRKKFRTTSKTFESIFHKPSSGKSTKSSKHKATAVPTSPSTKENVVVTTSTGTSSISAAKKKDKGPSWTNYEIPSKPSRKGPTLGVFYDSVKSTKSHQKTEGGKESKCIVLQTPDSIERYIHPFQVVSNYYQNTNYIKYYNSNVGNEDGLMNNYYFINMMAQRKSLLPYYVTKSIFGNVPGMGRVLVCGTQCGKIIFYSFFSLDELLVLDTRSVYDNYLSRDNSIDSESGCDMNKAIDSTLFEINCLSFISTFHNYSSHLAVGNHLGHLLLYQIPKLQLVKLIYPPNLSSTTSFAPNSNLNTFSSIHSYNTFTSYDSVNTDIDDVLIDELELMKIRRYKHTIRATRRERESASDKGDDLGDVSREDDDVVFISCLGFCSATGDLWVGYGNGNFAIYSYKFKLKYFYNPNHVSEGNTSNIIVDQTVYSVNNFEFCNHEHIVLVLYGNVKVDIFSFEGTFLSTISATRLTNSSIPISTIDVSNTHNNSTILYIGLMDGSLLIKQILYTTNGSSSGPSASKDNKAPGVSDDDDVLVELLSNSIEFILLYNLRYKIDGELNFGAPITSICPVPSQNLVLLGNASGGLSVISNLDF